MKNIDINEWLLNNNIDPLTEIVSDDKQWFLSDILEKHLKEQFAIHDVVGRSEQFTCKHCGTHEKQWSRKNDDWYCKTCGYICR